MAGKKWNCWTTLVRQLSEDVTDWRFHFDCDLDEIYLTRHLIWTCRQQSTRYLSSVPITIYCFPRQFLQSPGTRATWINLARNSMRSDSDLRLIGRLDRVNFGVTITYVNAVTSYNVWTPSTLSVRYIMNV